MRLLAALVFFTRLPFWRIADIPKEYFKRLVEYWSLTGVLTGGIMALVLFLTSLIMPIEIAIIFAISSRLIATGALHEDGLADFCDGFGGGTDRDRTLAIMKDSHIGTYGVLGLIIYFLLLFNLMYTLSVPLLCFVIISADVWSKACAANIINILPYARNEETAKAKVVYDRMTLKAFIISTVIGIIPPLFLLDKIYWFALLAPVFMLFALGHIMHKKIAGYTGDCCGATFLLCELSFYIVVVFLNYNLC